VVVDLTRRVAYKGAILFRVPSLPFLVLDILVRIAESNHLHGTITGCATIPWLVPANCLLNRAKAPPS
jgi:hypothetical protein